MHDDSGDIDRLRAAIEAHELFVAEHERRSVSDFLAEHEHLRDLLEPLFAEARPPPQLNTRDARVLGDFRLLRELGRGSMGIVYDAEQMSLGRRVAVKVLPSRLALDPDRRARFARESRLAAGLDHPGIAKVISADADDDVIWFAMERIDGAPLDRVLSRTADTSAASMTGGLLAAVVNEVARHGDDGARDAHTRDESGAQSTVWRPGHVDTVVRIGAQIAAALHHAHQHGVVHRDVKPANIVLRRDGSAVLTDFGLARDLSEPSLTMSGDYLGTPSYSAPEQLAGDRAAVDHRADIFALGVTLYELLTHRRPFEASSTEEVRTRILTVEPRGPRRLNKKIPPDLSSVLLKALEKDPNQRYQSAAAMADDLRAVVEGRPVRARSARVHTRAWRWCRRNPWPATMLAVLLAVALMLLGIGAWLVRANMDKAIVAGVALARAGEFDRALAELMPLERQFPGSETEAALNELFRRHPCLASYALVSEADERVVSAKFSADGQWVVSLHQLPDTAPERFHLQVRRIPTADAQATQPRPWVSDPCSSDSTHQSRPFVFVSCKPVVAWLADDHTVAVGGPGRETSHIALGGSIRALIPASVPGQMAVACDTRLLLCDLDGRVVREWEPPVSDDFNFAILEDLPIWFQSRSGSRAGYDIVSFAKAAKPLFVGVGYPMITFDLADPTRMVVTTASLITAWRCRNGELEPDGSRENPLPNGVLPAPPGPDLDLGEHEARLSELPLWRSGSVAAQFLPPGAGRSREPHIVAIEDQVLRIWGAPEPRRLDSKGYWLEIARFEPAARGLESTAQRLWCAGAGTLASWVLDAEGVGSREGEQVDMPPQIVADAPAGMSPSCSGIAFDPGCAILACVRATGFAPGWGWVVVLPSEELPGVKAKSYKCSAKPNWAALSPDRRQLAVALENGEVELWTYDPERRELIPADLLARLEVDAIRLSCCHYLDQRFLLASQGGRKSAGGILRWDLDHRDAPPVSVAPTAIQQGLRCLAISADGQLVATGGDDELLRVMRVVRSHGMPTLEPSWSAPHGGPVFAVAFAERDGTLLLASADQQGGIRLWDAATGGATGIVREQHESIDESILSLDFSSDGRQLAACTSGGVLLLWDMDRPRRCLEGNRDCFDLMRRLRAESR